MKDYFDNIIDPNERSAAVSNYVYNELILRPPSLSKGAYLIRLLYAFDRLLGQNLTGRLAEWVLQPLFEKDRSEIDLPDFYVIIHNDLFTLPALAAKRRLAPGHFIGEFSGTKIGVMACRRGAFEALLQADALGRAGVKKIVFVGTCLRLSTPSDKCSVVISEGYCSERGRDDPSFPPLKSNMRLSTQLRKMIAEQDLACTTGNVYVAHRFVLEEGPETLTHLADKGCAAVEMEGIGFVHGLSRYGGQFASALIGLDRYWPGAKNDLINMNVATYIKAGRLARSVVQAAARALVEPDVQV